MPAVHIHMRLLWQTMADCFVCTGAEEQQHAEALGGGSGLAHARRHVARWVSMHRCGGMRAAAWAQQGHAGR